jgi:orotidine-5'-phosphate decarboxylase
MPCELILALDVPDRADARQILGSVGGSVRWVKIGLQMFTAFGPAWVEEVAALGFRVFLDLKLHDIPNTVGRAVESLNRLPIGMLTLHAAGGREMLATAQRRARPDLLLLAVTVLTSMDEAGLAEIGVNASPAVQVERLARVALGAGLNGLVCSPLEIETLRRVSPSVQLVTPGIRLEGEKAQGGDDQKRVLTPAQAAAAGANFLVVGRPILQAADPAAMAQQLTRSLVA